MQARFLFDVVYAGNIIFLYFFVKFCMFLFFIPTILRQMAKFQEKFTLKKRVKTLLNIKNSPKSARIELFVKSCIPLLSILLWISSINCKVIERVREKLSA